MNAPLYWSDIEALRMRAKHYLKVGTRPERRLAKDIMRLTAWVEQEDKLACRLAQSVGQLFAAMPQA